MVQGTSHSEPHAGRAVIHGDTSPHTDVHTAQANVYTPTDRIRWGPIIAGLFAALSTLAVLGVLGLAIGLSTYDAGDRVRNFGIGAGWWGAISALIAFALGGWLAARTAAVRGTGNGILQGAMVWVVAIPLLMYMLSSLLGSAASTAGQVAGTAANAAATASNNPDVAQQASAKLPSSDQVQSQVQDAANQVKANATPENAERAANTAAKGAWGTLASLLLGLGAAGVGGLLGARERRTGGDARAVA